MAPASLKSTRQSRAEAEEAPIRRRQASLIYAGGTIEAVAGRSGLHENGDDELDILSYFLRSRPRSQRLLTLDSPRVALRMVSENMSHGGRDWETLAEYACEEINRGVPGVVITHGTDTMQYTAAALSFLLRDVSVPVVLTGSNYPITDSRVDNDAVDNLYDSLLFATESRLAGVYIVFHHSVYKGTRVRKETDWVSGKGSFSSIGFPSIAEIKDEKIVYLNESRAEALGRSRPREMKPFQWPVAHLKPDGGFAEEGIGFFSIKPDRREDLECLVQQKGKKAILLELYDSCTAPASGAGRFSLLPVIEDARKNGVLFFATSRSASRNGMSTYSSSIELKNAGVISLFDMTATAAWVKLRWVLSQTENPDEIVRRMLMDVAGELSQDPVREDSC